MSQELGDLLVSAGAITEQELREAMAYQRNGGIGLAEAVVKLGFSEEAAVARAVAKQNGLPFIDLDKGRVADEILERLPAEFATEHGILPLMEKGGRLIVAVDDPFKKILAEQIEFMIDMPVACALGAPTALKRAIQRSYGATGEEAVAARMGVAGAQGNGAAGDGGDAPIVRLVTKTFQDAVEMRASDIHIEPGHGRVRVRFRIDGMLRDIAEHQEHLAAPLLSRLKIMANMDIAEKRKPQDGRIALSIRGREIDVRASILPSNHGETMVMRLLDRTASLIGLKELGFGPQDFEWFQRTIKRPNGICLVTGPTGSGKTTTLYAALAELNRPDVKIVTAEDPVEYHLGGINQVQVNGRIGLSFARILKAMLRCAPNIILVGEIRDRETAEVAIQAALTGHLVFSTLHTNDAPGALTRLIDLGVKPFLVSASVRSVLAQRLVRVLCEECRAPYEPGALEVQTIGLDPALLAGRRFYKPQGCRACEGSGYRGRMALFESLDMDPSMRDLTFRGASLEELRSTAVQSGSLRPLLADGARRVLDGATSVAEVLRVTR